MKKIERKKISKMTDDFEEMMEKESHHSHEIIEDDNGIYRWKADPQVNSLIDELNLNSLWILFSKMGMNKNSEEIRKMYRDMGYSISGYWEIFYWEVNNPIVGEYRVNEIEKLS
jgi:hypothetical protein